MIAIRFVEYSTNALLDNCNKYSLKIIDYSFMHVLEILYINIISNSLMKSKTNSTAFTMVTIIIILILILPVNILFKWI